MKKFLISIAFLFLSLVFSFPKAYNKTTIVIDPGHGGYDPGAVIGDIKEADLNLSISLFLKDILITEGYNVILTRENDTDLCSGRFVKKEDLNKRVEIINRSSADIAISIHMNRFSSEKYSGAQVFYYESNKDNEILAASINSSISRLIGNNNRRIVKRDNIYLLKRVGIPICIVECGFMSNHLELSRLMDENYQFILANSIYEGIRLFKTQ